MTLSRMSRKPADQYVRGSLELLLLHSVVVQHDVVLFNTILFSCSLQKKPLKLKGLKKLKVKVQPAVQPNL